MGGSKMGLNEIERDEQQARLKAAYEMGRANGYMTAQLDGVIERVDKLIEKLEQGRKERERGKHV